MERHADSPTDEQHTRDRDTVDAERSRPGDEEQRRPRTGMRMATVQFGPRGIAAREI